ncbi:MAG: hypothetical protein ACFFCD_01005 [Promethearchaeota archaeon]
MVGATKVLTRLSSHTNVLKLPVLGYKNEGMHILVPSTSAEPLNATLIKFCGRCLIWFVEGYSTGLRGTTGVSPKKFPQYSLSKKRMYVRNSTPRLSREPPCGRRVIDDGDS